MFPWNSSGQYSQPFILCRIPSHLYNYTCAGSHLYNSTCAGSHLYNSTNESLMATQTLFPDTGINASSHNSQSKNWTGHWLAYLEKISGQSAADSQIFGHTKWKKMVILRTIILVNRELFALDNNNIMVM